ncbi:MAG: heavy metal translocating P-type ATPase [Mariprofundaceae bacterium]
MLLHALIRIRIILIHRLGFLSNNNRLENCFHCGLGVKGAAACMGQVNGESHSFCCSGCLNVCQVIHEAGLDRFYQRLEKQELTLKPPPDEPADMDQYDLREVQDEFVQVLSEGLNKTQLMVEGIHCAACVWLIEKALKSMPGIIQAEVNLVHHRLVLQWQPEKVTLTQIMRRLSALGYAAIPFNIDHVEGVLRKQNQRLLFRLGFAGFGAMNIMWISIALYAGAFSGMSGEYQNFFHWVSFAIATPVLFYSGGPILAAAWQGLRQARLSMDLPIAIGAMVTYSYSLWQTMHAGEQVYFDTVVSFLFVILIGRYLEALARRNASSATLRLLELQPRMATRLTQTDDERVSIRKLNIGDKLRIRPGDKVPADGVIIQGDSHVDESMLTGESQAIHKGVGCPLIAGTINAESALVIEVEKTGADTVLSRIIHLVESAQGSKAPIQNLADRIVPYFVGTTLSLACLSFLYWFNIDMDTALLAATAVLIITCPCALGLATPVAIAVSTGLAAKFGVLIRNGEALECLSKVSHIVLDKTGTLTQGSMAMTEVVSKYANDEILQWAGTVERHYSHPLARAVCAELEAQELNFFGCSDMQLLAGLGVGGNVQTADGTYEVWVGNQQLMHKHDIAIDRYHQTAYEHIEATMGIAICVAVNGELVGLLRFEDSLREGAKELVGQLAQAGLSMTILTGDSSASASHLKQSLIGDEAIDIHVIAEVLPEDKAAMVAQLQQGGECVLMLGDGINDAPALAQADISIAMGEGTDVAMECSDIVLMGSDLQKIVWVLALGKRTLQTIRQNLIFSLSYNIVLVPAAMVAWITPIFAALAMPLSSLVVIGNAILIRWYMNRSG